MDGAGFVTTLFESPPGTMEPTGHKVPRALEN